MDAKQLHDLRLDFWFSLNTKQQRQLHSLGYSHLFCEEVLSSDLTRVTKSKKIMDKLHNLKRSSFRMVA